MRSLSAAAENVTAAEGRTLRRLNQQWQARALGYYETVGECWYPAQFYARSFPRIRFYPAVLNEIGEPEEVDSGPLIDLWDRVQDPGGGRSQLTTSYGQLMFVVGDGYLVVTEQEGAEAWEYLSPVELRVKPDTGSRAEYLRYRAPGIPPEDLVEAPDGDFEPIGNEARVYRMYRQHPTYSSWADSPVRAVLDLFELLKLLTLAAGAEAQSRAATRGMVYMPDELSLPPIDAEHGDEDPQADPLYQEFIEALTKNISDPGSASAMAPFWIRGPGLVQTANNQSVPMADLLRWIPLGPPDSYKAIEAWDKTIMRIAYGLDMPAEMVTGTGEVNHWGGWLLDEQGFRQHVAPFVVKFCTDFTAAYLRPAAIKAGIENADRVVVWFDPADAINHPDESKIAREAWRDGVVSSEYYRDKIGATEQDAPTEDDLVILLAVLGNSLPTEAPADGETAPVDGGTGADTEEGTPETNPQNGNGGSPVSAQTAAATFKILGAAELAVTRARALAGSRLRRRAQGCEPCTEAINNVAAPLVASALGIETVRGIITGKTTEADLVAGAGAELAETLVRWGVNSTWTVEIGNLAEQHALRTLYEPDPPPLPAGFSAIVAKALQ